MLFAALRDLSVISDSFIILAHLLPFVKRFLQILHFRHMFNNLSVVFIKCLQRAARNGVPGTASAIVFSLFFAVSLTYAICYDIIV